MGDTSMIHEELIQRYFILDQRANWTTLTLSDPLPSVYRTQRIGKQTGRLLLFTIGETAHGKATNLDREIKSIISREDHEIVVRPSTSGSLREAKSYVGVDLAACTRESLQRIVEGVIVAVRERA
jgi:hypothetical protein